MTAPLMTRPRKVTKRMTGKVESFAAARADKQADNTLISPAECCEDAAREIREGERRCTAALVITLDVGPEGDRFDVGYFASNLRSSQKLAVLEATKAIVLRNMNYIAGPD